MRQRNQLIKFRLKLICRSRIKSTLSSTPFRRQGLRWLACCHFGRPRCIDSRSSSPSDGSPTPSTSTQRGVRKAHRKLTDQRETVGSSGEHRAAPQGVDQRFRMFPQVGQRAPTLITRRSQVQILPPPPLRRPGNSTVSGPFSLSGRGVRLPGCLPALAARPVFAGLLSVDGSTGCCR